MAIKRYREKLEARAAFLSWMLKIESRYVLSVDAMGAAFQRVDTNFDALEAIKSKPLILSP